MSDEPTIGELNRRLERIEHRLNGKVFVSAEMFNLIITEIRKDVEEHVDKHSQLRYLVTGAILAASLSLVVGIILLFVRGPM